MQSTQALSVHGSASASATLTLKAVRPSSNILVICVVALELTVPMFVHVVLRFIVNNGHVAAAFTFTALWVNSCSTFLNSFMYVVLHRSIRRKVRLMLIGMHESCRRRSIHVGTRDTRGYPWYTWLPVIHVGTRDTCGCP